MATDLNKNLNALSKYLSEAIYEALTTQDSLDKYQKLIQKYAEKAEVDYSSLKTEINDFIELYQQVASDFVITEFQEKSLLAHGEMAYIQEETIKKLIHFVKTASKTENDVVKQEVRMSAIDGKKEEGILLEYCKTDQDFIQKEDIICFIKVNNQQLSIKSPISGRLFYKKGVGEAIPFGGTIALVSDEKRSGQFEYIWQDGTKYIGDFIENEASGKGKFIYPSGDVYIGDVIESKKNGFGKMTFANGDIYEGDWYADKMQGEGTFTIKSLDEFILFESRKMQKGATTYNLPNGDTAFAYFEDSVRHRALDGTILISKGKPKNENVSHLKLSNGDTYYGEFENGVFHGKGFYLYAKGNELTFRGQKVIYLIANYENGVLHGTVELNFDGNIFDDSDLETRAINGKILAFEFPLLCHYDGDIQNGKGKVYTLQYNLYYFLKRKERTIEKLENELKSLKDDDISPSKIKIIQELEIELDKIKTSPLYVDVEFEKKQAIVQGKKASDYINFNPLELDLMPFSVEIIKSNKPDERKYYAVLEGNFKDFIPQGIVKFSNYYFTYKGELQNLQPYGKGSITFGNKKWEGHFENNHLLFGKFYENDELIYEGEFEEFYLAPDFLNNPLSLKIGYYSGKGILRNGEEYQDGEFSKGKFLKGKIKQKFSAKVPFYTNSLQEGFLEANINEEGIREGTLTFGNGYTITGTFVGEEITRGTIKLKDIEYDGELKDGNAHGKGKYQHSQGYVYVGEFKNGIKEGFGKESKTDGSSYEGEWRANEKHGEGKWVKENGEVYEGQLENGRKNGLGKLIMQNGDEYEGAFQADLFNGQGSLQSSNGDRYEGEWKGGKRHGEGTQILRVENKTLTGLWEEDKLIKDYNKKGFWKKMFGK